MEEGLGSSSSAIDSSNIGFQLLKKQGWKEGTGLGIAEQDHMLSRKKSKALSKRMRKLQEEEKRMQEKEFARAFFRDFWPDNV